jgi:hypothetical protein
MIKGMASRSLRKSHGCRNGEEFLKILKPCNRERIYNYKFPKEILLEKGGEG